MTVLPDGEILLAGSGYHIGAHLDGVGYFDIDLGEYKADGTPDSAFGSNGAVTTSLYADSWPTQALSVSALENGEILLYGDAVFNHLETFLAEYQVSSNPTSYANTTQTTTYGYDVRNKLVEVSVDGSTEATYTYNAQGDRVSETGGGVTTLYLTDTQNPTGYDQPVEEKTSASGKPVTTFILGDRVFAQADSNGALTYLLVDGHGSTRLLATAQGTITAAFNYDAFGNALNFNPNLAATPFLFGGDAMYDAPSGLYIHGDGVRQRMGFFFIERDYGPLGEGNPQDPLSLHKYFYANGDPINGSDPSGHFNFQTGEDITAICLGLGATIAAAIAAPALLGAAFVGGAINGVTNMAYNAGNPNLSSGAAFFAGFAGGFVAGALIEFSPIVSSAAGEFVTDEMDALFSAQNWSQLGKDQIFVGINTVASGGIAAGLLKYADKMKIDVTELQKFFVAMDAMQWIYIIEEATGMQW